MTREEAIRTLEYGGRWDYIGDGIDDYAKDMLNDALDVAVAALRE